MRVAWLGLLRAAVRAEQMACSLEHSRGRSWVVLMVVLMVWTMDAEKVDWKVDWTVDETVCAKAATTVCVRVAKMARK